MGESARWVCHTCKTVCPQGGRPIFQGTPSEITTDDIDNLRGQIEALNTEVRVKDEDVMISFLNDLRKWLSRHEGHDIHIGSDYSTDMMDLDDYRNESVDGKVSDCTRAEAREKSMDEWIETSIREIDSIIQECINMKKKSRDAAVELYNRFSIRDL